MCCSPSRFSSTRILGSIPILPQQIQIAPYFKPQYVPNYTRNQTLNTRVVPSFTYSTMYQLFRVQRPRLKKSRSSRKLNILYLQVAITEPPGCLKLHLFYNVSVNYPPKTPHWNKVVYKYGRLPKPKETSNNPSKTPTRTTIKIKWINVESFCFQSGSVAISVEIIPWKCTCVEDWSKVKCILSLTYAVISKRSILVSLIVCVLGALFRTNGHASANLLGCHPSHTHAK